MDQYRALFRWIYFAGQPRMMIIGVVLIIVANGFSGGTFGDAIPYGTLWVLACFTCRMISWVLPTPAAGSSPSMPMDKPLPKAAIAVSITPACPPEACPNEETMIARLAPELRRLIAAPV